MKFKKYLLLCVFLLVNHFISYAQLITPFATRLPGGNVKIKGDLVLVGNNIISRTETLPAGFNANGEPTNLAVLTAEANTPYNLAVNNNLQNLEYIDIDGDPTTFSSSRADLNIGTNPDGTVNAALQQCKRIVYAGLYWTASYVYERAGVNNGNPSGTIGTPIKTDWNQIKFRIPGGVYLNITADNVILSPTLTPNVYNRPYVCYKDVTTLLQGLAEPNGQYFVANQRASRGINPNGNSGGWGMVVIYESPTLPSKFISTFDGYANIENGTLAGVNFDINGFQTLPPPFPVKAKIGVSALEGDKSFTGDNLLFKANSRLTFSTIFNALNPTNNFFNASITNSNFVVNTRLPNSTNTLGFDLDIVNLNNPNIPVPNAVLPNDETGGTIRLTTNNDSYGAYLTTFAVDVIAPDIQLTKEVTDINGNPIGGANVKLCDDLIYKVGFQNIGNDNVKNLIIRDVLPINITFNQTTDLVLPAGVTLVSYTPGTRELVLSVDDTIVEIGDPRYPIFIKVKVVCSCIDLDDACANEIKNQAFATYSGYINTNVFTNEGSISSFSTCLVATPSSTNFLVGIDQGACNFTRDVILCGNSVQLTAANGYTSYVWTGPPGATITPVPGTNNQSVIVNAIGTYTVNNNINQAPCKSTVETINVINFAGGAGLTNPILPYNENLPATVCSNNGIVVPFIYLCGANDTQLLATNVTGVVVPNGVIWEKLNPACLTTSAPGTQGDITSTLWNPLCPREGLPNSCWIAQPSQVGNPGNFLATMPGEYRVTYTFQGNCTRTFYFNVYQNLLNPTFVKKDVVCNTLGEITINNVPPGYTYTINPTGVTNTTGVFTGLPAGVYTVTITQSGVVNGCVFTVPDIPILNRNFTVTNTVTETFCFGDKASIKLAANNVNPQYTFILYNAAGQTVDSSGLINPNTYTFPDQPAGTYTYVVTTTPDGCSATGTITITTPPQLVPSAIITKPLLPCSDGEITLSATGGVGPYNYTINGTLATGTVINVTNPGTYNICAIDTNNCTACTTITIARNPPPVFNITQTNILCAGSNSGAININVTNANGFTLTYSIQNGAAGTFGTNPFFTNLAAGNYFVVVQYTLAGVSCTTAPQTITITEPANVLTASGGVSQVACLSNGGNGIIRITNPQGGTPPYQYNLGSGYQTLTNQANVPPGTYTISIKDANGCEFFMTVTVAPIPAAPTISVGSPVYACDGSASTTVTVLNPAGTTYNYQYTIDVPLVPPHDPNNNVFTNVPCGPHNITVNSTLVSPPTFSELLTENFGSGPNTTSPGIAAAYCWNNQPYPPGQACGNNPIPGYPNPPCGDWFLQDNQYVVTSSLNPNNCQWFPYLDHTSGGTDTRGRFLAVNIGSAAGPNGILYSKLINDVIPNQPVNIDLYVANLINAGNTGAADPSFLFELVNTAGVVVASLNPGIVDNITNGWQNISITLNPGANTTLTFRIRSGSILYNGNDAAIDDIRVYQLPLSCTNATILPIDIPCDQAFMAQITGHTDATCNGLNDGTITIFAKNFKAPGFQISVNNGATWNTYNASPVTITVPAGYPGYVLVRYDATIPASSSCYLNLPQVILNPAPITVTATPTPATCLTGGIITVTATGGTGAYQYQLVTSPGGAPTGILPAGNIFNNVPPGSYNVIVTDANSCSGTTATPVNIAAPSIPAVTITSASCFTATTPSTIVVNATGGTGTYTYFIDNVANVPPTSNTFNNVAVGTHTIYVIDTNGCKSTPVTPVIAPQLIATGSIIKGLDCTATPSATIQGAINGGTAPFTYTVNGGASVTVTGTTFTYSVATAGSYVFVITDARGCTSTFTQVVTPITNPTVTVTSPTIINCAGDRTGSLNVVAAGGLPGYTITIVRNTLPTLTITGPGPIFNNLPAGNYTVTVKDANSCTVSQNVDILENPAINFTPIVNSTQCNALGFQLGSIETGPITGGTAPYRVFLTSSTNVITLPSPQTSNTGGTVLFDPLNSGTYQIRVVDFNNCEISRTNLIVAPPPTALIINTSATADCTNGATIIVSLVPTGSPGPFTFGIYNGSTIPPFSDNPLFPADGPTPPLSLQHTFSNLIPGLPYTFVVYDATTRCYYTQTGSSVAPITNIAATVSNVNCSALPGAVNPIQITVTNFGGGTGVTYNILNSNSTPTGITGTINLSVTTSTIITLPSVGGYIIQLVQIGGANNNCSNANTNFTTTSAPLVPLSLSVSNNINANCAQPNALVTVQGFGGGGAPYNYAAVVSGSPAPTVFSPTNPLLLNSATSLTWDVYVQDATGCIAFIPVTIAIDPLPTVTPGTTNQCTATGTYTFNVTGTGIAPLMYAIYSINGTLVTPLAYQSENFTVTTPGTYVIIVKDKNNCTNLSTPIVLYPPIDATASFTTLPVCNTATGVITVVASGGSTNFTYVIAPLTGTQAGNVFSNIPPGNYVITVTDFTTNCTKEVPVNLGPSNDPTFTLVPAPVVCIGDSNGTITVNLLPGNIDFVYTYTITAGPAGFPTPVTLPLGTNVFPGLPAGAYTIEVVSGRVCRASINTTVDQPTPIIIPPPTVVQFNCNAGTNITNLAKITVNAVTGGNGPAYTYEFLLGATIIQQQGQSNVLNVTNLAGGTYTINVYDSKGCLGTTTVIVNPFSGISNPVVTVNNAITCTSLEDITVTATVTGPPVGPLPLTYSLTGINSTVYNLTNTTGIFTGLGIGNYNVVITNPNTNCSITTIHYVFDPKTFILDVVKVTDVICKGGTDGSVTLTVTDNLLPPNNAGAFSYILTNTTTPLTITGNSPNAGPTPTITGLTAGLYTASITLTNTPFCPVTSNFTIVEPNLPLAVTTTSSPITCVDTGTITAIGAGGWQGAYVYQLLQGGTVVGNYTFAINGTNNVFTNLGPGTYTVEVRDIKGCVAISNPAIVLATPAPIAATTITYAPVPCKDDTTTLTITGITGGQGSNYSYLITGPIPAGTSGPQPITSDPFNINNLFAGTYTIEIFDGWGCKGTFPITIVEPTKVLATLTTKISPTCVAGTTLTLTGSGGTPPYTYGTTAPYNTPFTPPAGLSTDIVLPVNANGSFSYYIKDANGCISLVSNTVKVEPVVPMSIKSIIKQDIKCGGDVTGQINVVAQNGLGGYSYTLLNAASTPILGPQNTGLFTGLAAGTYFVQITGMGGCGITTPAIIITEPPVFTVTLTPNPVKCFGGRDGSITIQTTNGIGTIVYGIDPPAGQAFVVISNPANTPTTVNPPITYTIQNLTAGSYEVLVQDQNGCFYVETIVITEPLTAVSGFVNATDIINETCLDDMDGQFTVSNIGGGIGGPYTISLYLNSVNTPLVVDAPINNTAGPNTHVFSTLNGGNYIVIIKDANACTKELDVEVKKGIDMEPVAILTYPCVDNKPSVKIEVVNVNNLIDQTFDPAADYMFVLNQLSPPAIISTPQLSNVFTSVTHPQLLTPGDFTVTVTNINTCTKTTAPVTVSAVNLQPLTLTLSQGGLNQIVATATGGSGGYTFTFNGEYTGSNNTYIYYSSGVYTVIVTDSSGCTAEAKKEFIFIPIVIPDFFTPNGDGTNPTWSPLNTSNYKNLKTFVYDRYGRKVREMNEGEKWDGKYEGKELPSGDYWYVVKTNDVKNDQEFVGHFTLYR
jgi:large repetitive protein